MEKFLEVYGSNARDDHNLDFFVYTKLDNGITFAIGNYTVTREGSVFGSIDQDFCNEGEELIIETKKAILDSGLQEIVGDDIEIFSSDIFEGSINFDLCIYPDINRWERAKRYIQNNGIIVYGPTDLEVNRLVKK